ncbi:branched-chain amino acid aminotransferase 2, chloroplastic-like [Hordeum vulgare subsp. vulgare]|nr:branched-chain amino acid aminotransferase 2, chloroplastic-like [Hordeum vulgare subsp. vulgare]
MSTSRRHVRRSCVPQPPPRDSFSSYVSPPPCRVVNQPTPAHRRPPAPARRTDMELRLRASASPASASPRGTVVSPCPRPYPRLPSRPIQKRLAGSAVPRRGPAARRRPCSTLMTASYNTGTPDLVDFDWETLGFQLVPTDFMYIMKCSSDGVFTKGELVPYGPIELNPAAAVLNYGQGLLEGLRAHRKEDGSVIVFRPEENALRMRIGADRLCMPAPSVEQFLSGVKQTILANKRWVPPTGKGSLYIRPLLIGSGAMLGVAPAPEYTFVVYVCPVGHYFKDGLSPISLLTEEEYHRAAPGGTGDIKTIGNYASVVSAQRRAKEKGHSDVLYLDPVHKKFVEEVSSCNIFMVKDNVISTPLLTGTILPGITRRSIIEIARNLGIQVEERLIAIDELLDADEVFCTGTAVVLSPVGCIVYHGRRVEYGNGKVGAVSQQLYSALTAIQKGLAEDSMGWSVQLN